MSHRYTHQIGKKVEVVINQSGTDLLGEVGISVPIEGGVQLFGLVAINRPDHLSHMSYGLDYFDPEEVLRWCDLRGGYFYFLGSVEDKNFIKISKAELLKAFIALDLLTTLDDIPGDGS
jgi:hypothetical protein